MGWILGFLALAFLTAAGCGAVCACILYQMKNEEIPQVYMAQPAPKDRAKARLRAVQPPRKDAGRKEWQGDTVELLAAMAMAEAEGEPELGKRLVIDTAINRARTEGFPNTIREVIIQPGAYTSYWDGRMEEAKPTEEYYRLVAEELISQTNEEVLFFQTGGYPAYGEPLFQEGSHYFSGG